MFEFRVGDHQHALLVPGNQTDLFVHSDVQFVEALGDVRHIQPRVALVGHLMEHVVSEQLQHVPWEQMNR